MLYADKGEVVMDSQRNRFVSFQNVLQYQLFRHDDCDWVKTTEVIQSEGITFNSIRTDNVSLADITHCEVDVRLIDEAALVNIGKEDSFFSGSIRPLREKHHDNDN